MPVAFTPGQDVMRGDLDIFLKEEGNPTNAFDITYEIFFLDITGGLPGIEVPVGSGTMVPINPAVGEYYAALMIPGSSAIGTYHIRWTIIQMAGTPAKQVVMEFAVVATGTLTSTGINTVEQQLISKLRVLIRDNNPDRNYNFRPPEHEQDINQYNRVFGYVWEDHELLIYLECALDGINAAPPMTGFCDLSQLIASREAWRHYLMWGAMAFAANALAFNWVQNEFDYSIGGISLSLDRHSKYMSLKQNAEDLFREFTGGGSGDGIKQQTTKILAGLQQPRLGIGIRSAFGPNVGRGILSPRSFVA